MPNLSIKDVPEAWAHVLRQQAAKHHRSLQGELMAVLESAVNQALAGSGVAAASSSDKTDTRIVNYDKRGWPVVRQGWKSPEEIFTEMRAAGATPVPGQPLGVDIIRLERDGR